MIRLPTLVRQPAVRRSADGIGDGGAAQYAPARPRTDERSLWRRCHDPREDTKIVEGPEKTEGAVQHGGTKSRRFKIICSVASRLRVKPWPSSSSSRSLLSKELFPSRYGCRTTLPRNASRRRKATRTTEGAVQHGGTKSRRFKVICSVASRLCVKPWPPSSSPRTLRSTAQVDRAGGIAGRRRGADQRQAQDPRTDRMACCRDPPGELAQRAFQVTASSALCFRRV
jgi:hypothetical protein